MRRQYLMKSLRKRGCTWPDVQGVPPTDPLGELCSFLASTDPNLDAVATYHELAAKDREARIKAKADEIGAKYLARVTAFKEKVQKGGLHPSDRNETTYFFSVLNAEQPYGKFGYAAPPFVFFPR